jgi:DNA polymerase kappa
LLDRQLEKQGLYCNNGEQFHPNGAFSVKQDQEEINRIIAEASKGSKFYEVSKICRRIDDAECDSCGKNEKRKDKELTEKISKLLKTRDELMKNADICM